MNFFPETFVDADGKDTLGHAQWCELFLEAQEEIKRDLQAEGIVFDGARIIYSTIRFIDGDAMIAAMQDW